MCLQLHSVRRLYRARAFTSGSPGSSEAICLGQSNVLKDYLSLDVRKVVGRYIAAGSSARQS